MNLITDVLARAALTDPRTGLISRPWLLFFQSLLERAGGPGTHFTATELMEFVGDLEVGALFTSPDVPPIAAMAPEAFAVQSLPWTPSRASPPALSDLAWLLADRYVPPPITPPTGLCPRTTALLHTLAARVQALEDGSAFVVPPPFNTATLAAYTQRAVAESITGVWDFVNGLKVGSNETALTYDEGTFTATGTGFTVNPTGTALYLKWGKLVALCLPQLSGTSNLATFTITGLPAAITPTQTVSVFHPIQDNGGLRTVGLVVMTAGSTTLDVYATAAAGAFTNSGTKTLYSAWVFYAML